MRTSKSSSKHAPRHMTSQPAQAAERGPRRFAGLRFALAGVVLVVALLAANVVLALCLQPYGSITEVAWWTYRQADQSLDTVFLGNSRVDANIDPQAFDDEAHAQSLCLATVFQPLEDSATAAATVLREHELKRVILGVSPSTFMSERHIQSSSTFTQAKALGESPWEAVGDYARLLTSDEFFANHKSITSLMPWTYSHVPYDLDSIRKNLRNRRAYGNPIDANHHAVDPDFWRVDARGDRYIDATVDFLTFGATVRPSSQNNDVYAEDNKREFVRFLELCEAYDVQVYVVAMPLQFYDLVAPGERYAKNMTWVQATALEHGATYLDYSMARKEAYAPTSTDWADTHHLNLEGSRRLSKALARDVRAIEAGEDVSSRFYSYDQWDQLMREYDHVYLVGFEATPKDGGLGAQLWSFAGTKAPVEYEVSVLNKNTGAYEVVSPFGTDDERWWPMEGKGSCTVRVTARYEGSPGVGEASCVLTDVSFGS